MQTPILLKGHCNCGRVTFEAAAPLAKVYVCHCSICRRATGTIGVTVVIVPEADFFWKSGSEFTKRWEKPGHDWQCSFCTECGSQLPGKNDAASMYIPAGLISEGQEHLQVAHHLWVSSKAPWHRIGDSGLQHPEGIGPP